MGRCRRRAWKRRLCHKAQCRSVPTSRNPNDLSMTNRTVHTVGIIMNGVTGRMGFNQHLKRSILAIMQQGGVRLSDSEFIMPRPLLVGRNAAKLEAISKECGGLDWSTDVDKALDDPQYSVYFDAQTTD